MEQRTIMAKKKKTRSVLTSNGRTISEAKNNMNTYSKNYHPHPPPPSFKEKNAISAAQFKIRGYKHINNALLY